MVFARFHYNHSLMSTDGFNGALYVLLDALNIDQRRIEAIMVHDLCMPSNESVTVSHAIAK